LQQRFTKIKKGVFIGACIADSAGDGVSLLDFVRVSPFPRWQAGI